MKNKFPRYGWTCAVVLLFGLMAAGSTGGSGLSGRYYPEQQKPDMAEQLEISGDTVIYVMTMRGGNSVAHRGEIKKKDEGKNGVSSASGTTEIEVTVSSRKLPSTRGVFELEQRKEGEKVVLKYSYKNLSSNRGTESIELVKK